MHDIRFIREQPEAFDAAMKRRGLGPSSPDILALDAKRRAVQTASQEAQARRNDLSKQVGEAKRKGENADALMQEVTTLKDRIAEFETQEKELGIQLDTFLSGLPNIPAADVPQGKDEKDNKELRRVGEPKGLNAPRQHFELGEALGLMDFNTASKLSGARFTLLSGQLARLERALGNYMLDIHTTEFGYTEMSPPLMVRDEIMYGTAQLPKFAEDQFSTSRLLDETEHTHRFLDKLNEILAKKQGIDVKQFLQNNPSYPFTMEDFLQAQRELDSKTRMWLIPTAEVPLTNIVNGDIVVSDDLPYRFVARTPCFRAEAGAAGKDTRGMLRQHQFYKVELVSITTPEQSEAEHERMTECAETILDRLELPFRTIVLCTGDMGFGARKTYDIEVWMPGQNTYREISSCSNCGDFQARRMNARCRDNGEKSTRFVHTLNGSGVAVGRCLIAVMENFQQPDGSIIIPTVLRPYMGGLERIEMKAA